MMQDILYRGKSEKTHEWVYGSLVVDRVKDEDGDFYRAFIVTKDERGLLWHFTEIEPETIGRYVGITCYNCNRDDQRPFQGDIVEIYDSKRCNFDKDPISKIYSDEGLHIVIDEHTITCNGKGRLFPQDTIGRLFPQDTIQIRVVGNVYDNPELVGEKYADLYRHYFGFKTEIED